MRGKNRTRRCAWPLRLALGAWISLGGAIASAQTDGSLAGALELVADDYWVAVNGGLPRPLAGAPRPPPGEHLVLLLRSERGELAPAGWRALNVPGDAGPEPNPIPRLVIDRGPPRASFFVTGPHVSDGDALRLAPSAALRIRFSDLSGVSRWQASDRHPGSSHAGRWLPGRHFVSVVATDPVGNEGLSGEIMFDVDADGPAIDWRISDSGLATAGGEIYRAPVTLEVEAADPSGVATVEARIDGRWRPLAKGRVTTGDESLALRASDRLGNRASVEARWRYDTRGPEIAVHAPDGSVRGSSVRLPVNGVLNLTVDDPGAGLEAARYRYNGNAFRPLPSSIRFVHRGRYRLEVQATDRLGNQTTAKWKVRTVNRASGGRR